MKAAAASGMMGRMRKLRLERGWEAAEEKGGEGMAGGVTCGG